MWSRNSGRWIKGERLKRFFFFFLSLFFFFGCSQKRLVTLDLNDSNVAELKSMPQEPWAYLQGYEDATVLKQAQSGYKEKFYRIWQEVPNISKEEVMWPHRVFNERKNFYGVNLKPLGASFYKKMENEANFGAYMSLSKKALTIRGTNIRAFPTDERMFKHPNIPGEGFPFDYLQNSFIAANKPLFV